MSPTFNVPCTYLKENVSQTFRKAVIFTILLLKDNPYHKWEDFMLYNYVTSCSVSEFLIWQSRDRISSGVVGGLDQSRFHFLNQGLS